MADERINGSGKFPQSYHLVWLDVHPWRSEEWLRDKLRDGFHIHHVDGDHGNDAPTNLVLIDGSDHMALHGVPLRDGIARWRAKQRKQGAPKPRPYSDEGERLYALKVEWDCEWKALAQRYFDGVKPDASKIWSSIGHGLMSKAKSYAKHCAKPWPPAAYAPRGALPSEADIASLLSRQ